MDKTWTYTEPNFMGKLQLTFSTQTQTESCDYIYITDSTGKNISGSPFSGTSLAGKTVEVPGSTVNIRLRTDGSVIYYGFLVTEIKPVPLEITEIIPNSQKYVLDMNKSSQLGLTAKTTEGVSLDVTNNAHYTSNNISVAEVSATGLITAKGYGSAVITATLGNYSTEIEVSVLPTLSNISVTSGEISPKFDSQITAYTVLLPFGTTTVPQVSAFLADSGCRLEINNATSLKENTVINVISPDNVTRNTYTVSFEVSKCIESDHPYSNNINKTWVYKSQNSFGPISLTFSADTYVEYGYDYIYIMDVNGKNIKGSPFTGNALSGKTVLVPGDTAVIRLASDSYESGYGFRITSVGEPNLSIAEGFIVDNINFSDIYGGNIDKLPDSGTINVSTKIKNILADDKKLQMFVLGYDSNNRLVKLKSFENNIISGNFCDFIGNIEINSSIKYVKVIILKSSTLEPITIPVFRNKVLKDRIPEKSRTTDGHHWK